MDLRLRGAGRGLPRSRGVHRFQAGLALLGPIGLWSLRARSRGLFLHRLGLLSFLNLPGLLLDYGSWRRAGCCRHAGGGILWDRAGRFGTDRVDCRRGHG